jgi:hypothetical protein
MSRFDPRNVGEVFTRARLEYLGAKFESSKRLRTNSIGGLLKLVGKIDAVHLSRRAREKLLRDRDEAAEDLAAGYLS